MTFKELRLAEPILKALNDEGYTNPTPIQEQAIPILLKGKDLLGVAQTGTGKTAAFGIPILHLMYEGISLSQTKRKVKALFHFFCSGLFRFYGDTFKISQHFT